MNLTVGITFLYRPHVPRSIGNRSSTSVLSQLTLASDNCHERTRLPLKNKNGLWTTMKLGARHDVACTADNLRTDSHRSNAPSELEHRLDKGTPRPIEFIALRNGKAWVAWSRHSSRIRRSIRRNPDGL
jgi:hypothetical protein